MSKAPEVVGAATYARRGRARKLAAPAASVVALMAFAALVVPAGAAAGAQPPKPSAYNVTTKFAIAILETPVYRRPTTRSGVVRRLAFYTPDTEALQTYRFISSRLVGRTLWEHIDVPMRPNGQTGWVKRSWLGAAMISHTLIVVSEKLFTLTVYRRGKEIFRTPVGVGHFSNPAWPTPTGHFWIAEAFPSSDPFYGQWAFGTTDYATNTDFPDGSIVGIHGTNEPWLIPGDPSHGCIRLHDPDILKLKTLVGIGTPVWIEP